MSQLERLAPLVARIQILERRTAAFELEAKNEDVRGKAGLLLASLRGVRATLDQAADAAALADTERMIDAISRRVSELRQSEST